MTPQASPSLQQLHGTIATPGGWVRGRLHFDARVRQVEGEAVAAPGANDTLLLPGFIDLHVHGGGGADVMAGAGAVDVVARTHARHGTTALLATTMTAPLPEIEAALRDVARAMREGVPGGAAVLGVHLEGPYVSPQRLGAQPAHTRAAAWAELQALHALAPLRVLTLAPEALGEPGLLPQLLGAGIRVQLGHSNASYEEAQALLQAGASGFTHLFNAMSPLHHRAPGLVGAALAHAQYAELIPDLLHVHPGAIRTALRAIPKLYAVSDATAATDMPDGDYRLGEHTVCKCGNGVRLPDGTLAGSVLTLDQALRHLVGLGLPLWDAVQRVATYPADYLGEAERGRLQPGAWADVVAMGPNLQVQAVWLAGRELAREPAHE